RQIDYRLTDPQLDPLPNEDCQLPIGQSPNRSAVGNGKSAIYSETSLHLPHTFWCYDPLTTGPQVNALPALERGGGAITFGCLNNFCKITPITLQLWASVLRAVPTYRLHLLAPEGSARDRIAGALAIDPARITFHA